MIFNDRRNAKALKAANGPSLAPKGYKPDTEARTIAQNNGEYFTKPWRTRKSAMAESAKGVDEDRGRSTTNFIPTKNGKVDPQIVKVPYAPKNKKGK